MLDVIRCMKCGKPVSTFVPKGTIISAWVECPDCLEKDIYADEILEELKSFVNEWRPEDNTLVTDTYIDKTDLILEIDKNIERICGVKSE